MKVFFVTNRSLSEQEDTLKNLAALGITASDDTVLCTGENGWTSDKTARRAEIATLYRVLLLVGDDMNDFVSTAKLRHRSGSPSPRRTRIVGGRAGFSCQTRCMEAGNAPSIQALLKMRRFCRANGSS